MSTCAVLGCSNNQAKNKDEFFRLPTTPEIKKAWLNAITKLLFARAILRNNVSTVPRDYRMNFITVIVQ